MHFIHLIWNRDFNPDRNMFFSSLSSVRDGFSKRLTFLLPLLDNGVLPSVVAHLKSYQRSISTRVASHTPYPFQV